MSIDTLRKNGTAQNNQYFTRDQLLTKHDLLEFREQLVQELKQLLTQPNTETKQWLKTFEVCKMLGISRTTLQTLRSKGLLNLYLSLKLNFKAPYCQVRKTVLINTIPDWLNILLNKLHCRCYLVFYSMLRNP